MSTQIIRRLLTLVPVLSVVAVVVFVLIHVAPGDPAAVMAGNSATTERIDNLKKEVQGFKLSGNLILDTPEFQKIKQRVAAGTPAKQ